MFTGIVETTAQILDRTDTGLIIERPATFDDIHIGSSICVSGCCLSIVEFDDSSMRFDVMQETWNCTKLGSISKGERVNLERALRADGRFEGHVVQGHVDDVGKVCKVDKVQKVSLPKALVGLVVPKGSIAIDGVSLTVCDVTDSEFTVALIPLTLKETTLGVLKEGDMVNLEADILWKYARQIT